MLFIIMEKKKNICTKSRKKLYEYVKIHIISKVTMSADNNKQDCYVNY